MHKNAKARRFHELGTRALRRRDERAKRLTAYAVLRLDRVTAGDSRKRSARAYDAFKRGLITKRQAVRLGVIGAVLYRGRHA